MQVKKHLVVFGARGGLGARLGGFHLGRVTTALVMSGSMIGQCSMGMVCPVPSGS